MTRPVRISLVTSVLNGEPYIGALLASLPQDLPVEHLVIDAGSTDGTLARLERGANLTLLSRPGMSLYAAWNLALERASGDALWFVNADDILPPGAVEAVLAALDRHPNADIVQGQAEAFDDGGRPGAIGAVSHRYPPPGDALDPLDLVFGAPVVNARVFRRRLVERAGPFDTGYRYAADRDWLLRLLCVSPAPACAGIDTPVYRYRVHGGSMTLSQNPQRRLAIAREHRKIAEQRLQAAPADGTGVDRLLGAWWARETLVGAAAALRLAEVRTGGRLAADLLLAMPRSVRLLIAARRHRRVFLDRLVGASGGSS